MPPNEIQQLNTRIEKLEMILNEVHRSDRYNFPRDISMAENASIRGNGAGLKIGKSATEKIAFWGATPVVQASAITSVTETGSATDGTARVAINLIRTALKNAGITA